jgi:hypothetical protein
MPNALRNTLALIGGVSSWVSASSREKRNTHGAKPDHHEMGTSRNRRERAKFVPTGLANTGHVPSVRRAPQARNSPTQQVYIDPAIKYGQQKFRRRI